MRFPNLIEFQGSGRLQEISLGSNISFQGPILVYKHISTSFFLVLPETTLDFSEVELFLRLLVVPKVKHLVPNEQRCTEFVKHQ